MLNGYKLCLKRSRNDPRNLKVILQEHEKQIVLPCAFQLKEIDTLKILDQEQLGSCTANAICQAIQIKTNNKLTISRLYQYFNSRLLEGTQEEDSGSNLLDCMKALKKYNYIDEIMYPYITDNFAKFPSAEIYIAAYQNPQIKEYKSIQQDLYHIKYALSVFRQAIIFGAQIYNTFQNLDNDYVCPTPDINSDTLLGGHALTIFAFYDNEQVFGIANSWGEKYGNHGTFKMKYDYVLNPALCTDFWTVSLGF